MRIEAREVRHIENLPEELNVVSFRVGHFPALAQTHIQAGVAIAAQHVARTDRARQRKSKGRLRRGRIRKGANKRIACERVHEVIGPGLLLGGFTPYRERASGKALAFIGS